MSNPAGQFVLQNAVNMNGQQQPGGKPSRQELLQRLQMAKLRGGGIHRMAKKQRENTVEKLKTQMDEQQKALVEALRSQMTPEQLAQMGIPNGSAIQYQTVDEVVNDGATIVDAPDISKASAENPITIPISIPKMSPVVKTE